MSTPFEIKANKKAPVTIAAIADNSRPCPAVGWPVLSLEDSSIPATLVSAPLP